MQYTFPSPQTVGAQWVTVASATESFPSDGIGGATTTAADSLVANSLISRIEGFILQAHDATSDLILTDAADGTVETFTVPASTQVGQYVSFGSEGIEVRGAWGMKLAAGAGEFVIFYRKYLDASVAE